ncbi:MAG: MIP/aquaporin family protein [Nevskiales bacterium]
MNSTLTRPLMAEMIGTFALVFAGCGAIVVNDLSGGVIGHGGIAACFGLVVMAMIYAVGDTSGAHFNPAVTLAFWLSGRLPFGTVIPYIVAQCLGAILASAAWLLIAPAHPNLGATQAGMGLWAVFLLEVIISFFLMFVILNVATGAKEKGLMAGVAIGATVALCALFAGPLTGASMNPARSLGPALVSGEMAQLWLYLMAPIVGTALAVPACRLACDSACCEPLETETK